MTIWVLTMYKQNPACIEFMREMFLSKTHRLFEFVHWICTITTSFHIINILFIQVKSNVFGCTLKRKKSLYTYNVAHTKWIFSCNVGEISKCLLFVIQFNKNKHKIEFLPHLILIVHVCMPNSVQIFNHQ
jgi:hypothetical protein